MPDPTPPTPPAPPAPGAPPTPPPPDDKQNELQARIDSLFGQRKQAEDNLVNAEKENADLRARLLAAEEKLALSTKIANSSSSDGGVPTSTPRSTPAADDRVSVLEKQLAELQEGLTRKTLEEKQLRSIQQARTIIPGLAAGDERLVKAATEILARDPELQKHAQGPMYAAALASVLGASSASPKPDQRAGLITPNPSAATQMEAAAVSKQIEDLQAQVAVAKEKMRGSNGSLYWPEYKNLMAKLGELQRQLKG